jgi:hypothetical protein
MAFSRMLRAIKCPKIQISQRPYLTEENRISESDLVLSIRYLAERKQKNPSRRNAAAKWVSPYLDKLLLF